MKRIYSWSPDRILLICCALFVTLNSAAQVKGNKYKEANASVVITHKAAKWFDLRTNISEAAQAMDTFEDGTRMFTLQDGIMEIQAAHTYMDTIYVHKGTSISLEIPDKLGSQSRVESYQRWYSFRTDGIFRTTNTGQDEVWDLLTPSDNNAYHRYANGYVGKPKGANMYKVNFYVPTDDEFTAWFGAEAAQKYDNNYYLVACDVSAYTDYTRNFSSNSSSSTFGPSKEDGKTYEPTLTHRVLFYIVTVDNRDTDTSVTWKNGMGRLTDAEFQGGTLDGKFLEEYDISFPFTRVSNHTLELVALSKDAWSYAVPGTAVGDDHDTLDVHLADNGAGISLATTKLQGMNRIIQFNYPRNLTDGTKCVNANNSTATIYVTKTVSGPEGTEVTYNLARFNLTFIRDTRLLTQTQVKQIENGTIADENMKYYQFRTDGYLAKNYQLLTSLNFDYDPAVAAIYGQPEFYPFPIAWTANSYSFFDGAEGNDFKNTKKYPEWGYYSIMSTFMEADHWDNGTKNKYATPLPGSTYHMYIDASDRPGVIARLPFRKKLCKGSELFVTAWLKSAGWSSNMADANMLFSIMGVKTDPVLGTIYEPIYRHSSSQVRRTDYLSKMPGTGPSTNEWMQMYFSFIIDADAEYDSYVLQIDNNSASTDGGDMYIDDIRVYMATPSAEVKQLDATCTNERTLLSIKLDWNRLLSRLGESEGQNKVDAIDFCFIDKVKYDDYMLQHPDDFRGAIENSVIYVGNNDPDGYYERYNTLYFNLDFDQNTNYDDKPHPRLAIANEGTGEYAGKYFFYGTKDESGTKALAVDVYSELTPNRAYMMLIQINDGNEATVDDFKESIDDDCGIHTSFYVTAQTLLRVNGEVVDPATDFCAGQIFNFSAQLRVPKQNEDGSDSYIVIDKGVYFDWFFGSERDFLAEHPEYGNETLQNALTIFRELYPDNTDLSDVVYSDPVEGQIIFTKNMYDLIDHYLRSSGNDGGLHASLVLHKENLDITLLNSGLQLVIKPIPTIYPPDGTIDSESWAKVCWEYVPLELHVSGDAPQLHAGFNPVKYPSVDFNPGLRIGLKQLESTTYENSIRINLRGAKLVSENAEYIGMITSVSPDIYSKIYLVDTDDPAYKNDLFFPVDFSEFSLPIGTLKSLYAQEYTNESSFLDYMELFFDTKTEQANGFHFQPKEGYIYTFAVHFEEHGDEVINTCFGRFTVDMKIVPEYLVWDGADVTGNWNNDNNWKRADKDDLKKTDGYLTNQENTTSNGFVPMFFSNVIMPKNSKAELYMAGYAQGGESMGDEWNTSRPDYMESPTENIQYDLMAYEKEGGLATQRYRVNICRDIHFEPGAQLLHAEQMIYNNAWIDLELASGKWTAVSMPLQGVVAGDWYAPAKTGRQDTEYFKDITFNLTEYNRLSPAVYQRSWSMGANIIENVQNSVIPVSFVTEWSSVFNDAGVAYTVGNGFSLKGVSSNDSLLFRFPKADSGYDVSTDILNRENAGRLLISDMVDRSNPYQYVHSDTVTANLVPSADGRYLMVGNPFMAPMDVQSFMEANREVLMQKYWLDSGREDWQAVVYDAETGTWSSATTLVPPYGVFYVEISEQSMSETGSVTVKFKADMQKLETASGEDPSVGESFRIVAENMEGTSWAVLRYANSANNDYGPEDAGLIMNMDGQKNNIPMVYTIAGNKAASVNLVRDSKRIPFGVFAPENCCCTVTFKGVESVKNAMLYDAETQMQTPLYDGFVLEVSGPTHGRYFIICDESESTGGEDFLRMTDVRVSSVVPHQVIIVAEEELRNVEIWTTDGKLIKQIAADGYICTLEGVDSGVAIVRIVLKSGVAIKKVMVK